ncbi:MAG: TrbC/VirB2 family protein [Rickettsiales bacterium]|nr:TrbC/VirB2 family protein [Rickettsiales bacterium]
MNKLKLFFLSLCLTVAVSGTDVALAASGSGTGSGCGSAACYKVGETSVSKPSGKGLYINCYNPDIGRGDQQFCAHYFSGSSKATCVMLESTIDNDPVATCDTSDAAFCRTDDDCKAKGSQAITCVDKFGQRIEDKYKDDDGNVEFDDSAVYVGMCSSVGANKDRNGIVIVLCNAIGVVTGGAGRAVVLIVVTVVGVLFFIGKVNWSLLVAIGLGVGVMFGAKAIVNIVTGGELQC